VYLASDDASFVSGKILRVDGGMWMWRGAAGCSVLVSRGTIWQVL